MSTWMLTHHKILYIDIHQWSNQIECHPKMFQLSSIHYENYRFLPTETQRENASSIIYQDLFLLIDNTEKKTKEIYNDIGGQSKLILDWWPIVVYFSNTLFSLCLLRRIEFEFFLIVICVCVCVLVQNLIRNTECIRMCPVNPYQMEFTA